MLSDRPAEQETLFKDITLRRLSVRETESAARHIAVDKVRKHSLIDPELAAAEGRLSERLGTKVEIQKKQEGGRIMIDFFSPEDLKTLLAKLTEEHNQVAEASVPVLDDRSKDEKAEDEAGLYSVGNFTV